MKLIKVAAACLNQTPFDWEGNLRNIQTAIDRARVEGVSVLCLPELCLTGYGCEDAFFAPGLQEEAFLALEKFVPQTRGMVVSFGLPLYFEKALYNAAALVVDGRIAGFVAKRFLAGDGIHYEPRWFKEWPAGERDQLERGDARFPLGDVLFDVGDVRIGFEICEDAWVANRPGADLALRGVDLILNPSASHFAFGKFAVRQRFVVEGSRAFGVGYLYANLLGNEAGRVIYDGGALIASGGELVARGRRFGFVDVELATAVVDVESNRREQARRGSHRPRHDAETGVIEVDFTWPERRPVAPPVIARTWEDGDHPKDEEFSRAVGLGLWDYMRKSRSRGYVVSISGGADSAACAVLVGQALALAVEEHGFDGVKQRLAYVPGLAEATDLRDLTRRLLLCAYQATENSGDVTRAAAREVAGAIGAEFHVLDVEPMVKGYVGAIEQALGRSLTWERDDVALQNIQARVRAPSIWLFANLRGALLLTTSNRSEAAVGYATMDGDTSGGLAPIGGIDKTYLRAWLRWMEAVGPTGLGPVPALRAINAQQPTAELRPPGHGQTDEKDLMPYDVLEAVEDAAIRDKRLPLEVLLEIQPRFPQFGLDQLGAWIERFFTLWCKNQWKRERLAPSFHLDDKNLDPRSWCRFPILSGGYRQELAAMHRFIADEHARGQA
ncbi:MAG TPA: NAD(+) synthase [Kofleriaceae bacterium]|jgi:NAD+ synthase (glutamine-hydrolysing)|nr:NAD(+) synthase [Kofleriaceae bacterium]